MTAPTPSEIRARLKAAIVKSGMGGLGRATVMTAFDSIVAPEFAALLSRLEELEGQLLKARMDGHAEGYWAGLNSEGNNQ